ncbi:Carboxylesterase NlhH [Mycobacterium simulans]|uniref:alpha/beta hydrolase n=1 Tax=Mycobacterium simulans TaxID=627089 RepID=UPI001748E480|nr:alpha/beta hydrolase [Mycobacterium simulans]SON62560.1 Carboxylesterase NlhH [Mycobacterium simulans]
MTKSLPGSPDLHLGAAHAPIRWTSRMQNTVTSVGIKVIPWIPARARRVLTGGRSVVIDGNTLDPTLHLMLSGQRTFGIDGLVVDDDAAASRSLMLQSMLDMPGPQIHVEVNDMVLPGPDGELRARHYRPVGDVAAPLLVFYHGGGFALGDLDTHDALCRLTSRDAGVHVLSVDYRLAPEHRAPAAVDDAYAAFQWAYEHAGELGAIPEQVAVGGDSAGGNLAAVVAQLARDSGGPTPVLQWLIYPRTDFTAQTRSLSLFARGFLLTRRDINWFESQYLRGSGIARTDPRVSPALTESLSGLAPALIAVAGFDPLRDEGAEYAMALRAAGTAVDLRRMGSLTHGFVNLFQLGGGCATGTSELISALRAHLSRCS